MALDVAAIQQALRADGLDGWLLYDFHGSNPIAARLAGLTGGAAHDDAALVLPDSGDGRAARARSRHRAAQPRHLPGDKIVYAGRQQLDAGLTRLLDGHAPRGDGILARCARFRICRGSTPARPRPSAARGVEIVSSGDLVQQFEAAWTPAQLASHRAASDALYRIKDRAFAGGRRRRCAAGRPLTEYDLQQQMVGWFEEEGLVSDSAPVVAVGGNAGNPHYLPTADAVAADRRGRGAAARPVGQDSATPGAVFADITWVGVTGRAGARRSRRAAFRADRRARGTRRSRWSQDAARRRARPARLGGRSGGAARCSRTAGYGDAILHRTGHSLGENVHGNGVHLDDYETHDDRRMLPGTGFTVEPGLYFDTLRRAHRDQRVSRRARGAGHRAAPDEIVTL